MEYFQKIGEISLLARLLEKSDVSGISLNFLDYTKKYDNDMTLLEYCY